MKTTSLLLAALLAAPAAAQHTLTAADKIKLSEALDALTLSGDLRLRHESLIRKSAGSNDRSRLRYRLRLGAEAKLPHDLAVVTRFASGTGDQLSTNQSYDDLGSQKQLWIDQVFAKWTPKPSERLLPYLMSGRMANPLWRTASSDLIWDDDFNPEGLAQGVEWKLPAHGVALFANALQMVADEDSGSARNQWLFSQQIGADLPLPGQNRLKVAAAYHKWTDENRNSYSVNTAALGTRKTGTVLTNRFGVGEVTAQVSAWVREIPVVLQGTIARNLRAREDLSPRARDGFQYGVILGSAKPEGGVELGAFYKYAEADVTVADVADSDFGEGGTNRKGGIFWLAYSPKTWMNLRAKYFSTKIENRSIQPAGLDTNRLQLDWSVKF